MALDGSELALACGVSLDALVDQVTEPERPGDLSHQAGCPDCQAALATLREAWGELRGFAAQPVTVPPGLGARVMARIRALVALWGAAAVLSGPGGETRIDQSVLAQVARRAALAVPGVVLASALGVAVDPADRRRVSLSLRLAITFGPAIDALSAAVREQVSRHLNTQAGVKVIDVDIAVEDVVSGPSPGAELFAGRAV